MELKFLGLAVGSWAEWAGAVATTTAVAISLYSTHRRPFRFTFHAYTSKKDERLHYNVVNQTSVIDSISIQAFGLIVKRHLWSRNALLHEEKVFVTDKSAGLNLNYGKMHSESTFWMNVPEMAKLKHKKVIIQPYVLGSDGHYYQKRLIRIHADEFQHDGYGFIPPSKIGKDA